MAEPIGKEAKKTLDKWKKIAGLAPKKLNKSDLSKVQIPKVKLHASLAKLTKDVDELSKEYRKILDKHNKESVTLSRAWLKEIQASTKKDIPADEIPSRKTMLIETGMKVRASFNATGVDLQVLAKKAIVVGNETETVKKEVRKAQKLLKKKQKEEKAKDAGVNIKVLGNPIDAREEDLKALQSQAESLNKDMNKFSDELYKSWKVMEVHAIKEIDGFLAKIRAFKAS